MDTKTEKLLGIEIKTVRESKGLHQKDVIAKYKALFDEDLTQARLSSYETGKRTASIDTLAKIAKTLDWELHHIIPMSMLKSNSNRNKNPDAYVVLPTTAIPNQSNPSYYHPLINYLDTEDFGVDICKDEESKIEIKLTPEKGEPSIYTKKEFEALNRSVKEFIEFQLYKKSSK